MLRLGMVQFAVVEGDVERNCARIEQEVKNHAQDGVDILCFPELCISGYKFEKGKTLDEQEFMSKMAGKYQQPLLAGVQAVHEGKYYDTVCLWDEEGKLLGEYRKIHLWASENDYFDRGDGLITVDYKGWKIGLLICADLGFAEVSTPLALKKGADVIIYPSAWGYGWEELFSGCAKTRAAENQVYIVALNRACGDEKYCGNTTVANPDGTVLVKLETTEEAYAEVILKKSKLEEAREGIPWRKMKQLGIYEGIAKE